LFLNQIPRIVTLANLHHLPAIYGFREYAEAGGLMSYGLSYRNYYKNVARYVDKVLRGTKPADMPVEQPTQLQLVVNLKAAKALGITIPQSLLLRADELIQ
jgi:putative ABC transport system substrate-binding protein